MRPSGANAIAVGFVSPLPTDVSTKLVGKVAAEQFIPANRITATNVIGLAALRKARTNCECLIVEKHPTEEMECITVTPKLESQKLVRHIVGAEA
jgi:hypothetical protein